MTQRRAVNTVTICRPLGWLIGDHRSSIMVRAIRRPLSHRYLISPASTRHSEQPCSPSSKASTSTSPFSLFGLDSPSAGSSSGKSLGHPGGIPTPPSDCNDRAESVLYATHLQHKFDSEDCALSVQCIELAKSTQRLFVCSICLEEEEMHG